MNYILVKSTTFCVITNNYIISTAEEGAFSVPNIMVTWNVVTDALMVIIIEPKGAFVIVLGL
jgi:hypothetical protein